MTPPPVEPAEPLLRKFQKELSAGTVSLALLGVLAAAPEPMYGYQIAKRLEQVGAGLLDSFVEPSVSGPPRRYYRITAVGRDTLRAWADAWRATRDSVDTVLEGHNA